eukprot:scaffold26675_cov30-Phaeocystis_antarctica.AAC.1
MEAATIGHGGGNHRQWRLLADLLAQPLALRRHQLALLRAEARAWLGLGIVLGLGLGLGPGSGARVGPAPAAAAPACGLAAWLLLAGPKMEEKTPDEPLT